MLDEIPGGFDGPQVRDIGPQAAKIVFSTTVPVVCNVAYGTDESYGRLAVMAMAGATTDHEVQLLGLEPDPTYHFRITVTDAASNIYRSDGRTFTTIAGDKTVKSVGLNVAAASEGARIIGHEQQTQTVIASPQPLRLHEEDCGTHIRPPSMCCLSICIEVRYRKSVYLLPGS